MKTWLLLALLLAPAPAFAFPRDKPGVTRTARNDGDSASLFAISCSSYAWTVVGSSVTTVGTVRGPSRLRRRSMTVQTLGTVTYAVCFSSTIAAADTCSDTRAGHEIGAAWGSLTLYDEAAWYCQTRTGGPTVIKGAEHFDSRDEDK